MGQSPVSADTMVRTIHDMRFGLQGRLRGVITPPFRRTLRENPHPAHRECEASWGAAATKVDRIQIHRLSKRRNLPAFAGNPYRA